MRAFGVVMVLLLAGIGARAAGPTSRPAEAEATKVFLADCAAKAAAVDKAGGVNVAGAAGWLFWGPELRHVSVGPFWGDAAARVSQAPTPDRADPLPAILDFKAQLDQRGIALLLVPVPAKATIYADRLSARAPLGPDGLPLRTDIHLQAFYRLLGEKGVKVLDLTPAFLAARKDDPARGVVYCRQDPHWSGRGCEIAAEKIAGQIGQPDWLKAAPKLKLVEKTETVEIAGRLYETLPDPKPAKERLPLRLVGRSTPDGPEPLAPDPASPVILLGDSHTLVFHAGGGHFAVGAGLPDHLAARLGFAVDLVGSENSGARMARVALIRRARGDARYLAGKRLVIWCFTVREFTEGPGWGLLPIPR